MAKKKGPEKEVQDAIMDYLKVKQIYAWVNKTQGTFDPIRKTFRRNTTKKGISDILGIMPDGRFLAIEVKSPKIKLPVTAPSKMKEYADQIEFLSEITSYGGVAMMVNSLDMVMERLPSCRPYQAGEGKNP